ncbi:MAG TPA: hypothetical protein VMZ31_04835 [Phycisphaerae bacterium]|nr:hypothetical protein [Phycisphaerae bacterium]
MFKIASAVFLLACLVAGLAAADVYTNAEIAQERMRQLSIALETYRNEHFENSPSSPADLWPEYVRDPLIFWHPGDSDPPPTMTIDNAIPNAPNSAAISFDWVNFGQGDPWEPIMLRDNTADNNGGLFINLITEDGIVETDPPLAAPTPTVDELAQAHLRRIHDGLMIYANDNHGLLPDDLMVLWDLNMVRSPRTFWHPGDSDPMPTDITNSVPNAINSTQISFEFTAAGQDYDALPCDAVLLRDNTPGNNGGAFIYVITADGGLRTNPPQPVDDPFMTRMAMAARNLRGIGQAMYMYANDNYEYFPDDLIQLWDYGLVCWPDNFWNPGDSDPMPTDITNSVPDALNSTQISFEYLASGLKTTIPPDTVVLRDNTAANNGNFGRFVCLADSSVHFELEVELGDGNADGSIDLADWQLMALCLNGPLDAPTTLDVYYYVFDFNFDDVVDLEDVAAFMAVFTGPPG